MREEGWCSGGGGWCSEGGDGAVREGGWCSEGGGMVQ